MAPFSIATFLAAFLLFLVQPLLGKAIAPWFGGTSSVWTTSLVFYQALLLGGYAYAHFSSKLRIGVQAKLHMGLLLLTLLALPILPSAAWRPMGGEDPTVHLLLLLAASVGAPYLLLSSTSPLLHDWFGRSAPGRSPYFLYSLSNAGSLLALLAYPFVVEPMLDVDTQARMWTVGYAILIAVVSWIAWNAPRRALLGMGKAESRAMPGDGSAQAPNPPRPSRGRFALWFLLSACGSGLLLATTNQMTLDVASVPFLWVMPLAIYLLTFILAFAGVYSRTVLGGALVVALAAHAFLANPMLLIVVQIAGAAGVLFVSCMVCHGELARSAPEPAHLTAFYLTMSAGGVVGGASVSLLAPLVLTDLWELPGFLILAWMLLGVVMWVDGASPPAGEARTSRRKWTAATVLAVGTLAAVSFARPIIARDEGTLVNVRNFYGVLSVLEGESPYAGPIRGLRHGRVLHGSQLQSPGRMSAPTTYYAEGSGVHLAMTHHPRRRAGQALRIAAIGEGVGAIAAWTQPGDTLRFLEIDPDVDRLAREYFTYIEESLGTVEVIYGDGRLSLERELGMARRYDVIVLDAFSGDAIPTHLLTREAADLYWSVLEPDGLLAMHVTSSHLDLDPVVRGMAAHAGHPLLRLDRSPDPTWDIGFSRWLLMSAEPAPYITRGATRESLEPSLVWTDRFSNLLQVLR